MPGQNTDISASEIIDQVIAAKEKMFADLSNYKFNAYIRCVIRENNDVGLGAGSIKIDPGLFKESLNLISNIWKTKPMRIDGIDEFVSKGYYKKPDSYREIIEDENSYSRLPRSLEALLGTHRIQNLYDDEISFFDRSFPGPLAKDAPGYYKYSVKDTLWMDRKLIFKIHFEPADRNDPGLVGNLFVQNHSYPVIKIEANLNQAANTGNNFNNISLMQQYIPYQNHFYLPVDYRMSVSSDYIGVVKVQYEYNSLIESYKINYDGTDDEPGDAALSIISENGKNNPSKWSDIRAIPFTQEELIAYEKIDSLRSLPKGFFYKAAKIISPRYQLGNHFSISGPLGVYQFNHVEGHTISFTAMGNNLFDNSLDMKLTLSNGFADKRFKENVSTIYSLNDAGRIKFSFNLYNKLETLFSSADRYNSITTTIYSLLYSHDFRSYYYTKGFDFRTDAEVSPSIRVYAAYANHVDHSAQTNTTFSILGSRHRNFSSSNNLTFPDSVNPPIYDTRLNTVSFGINFDFRDYILENNLIRKESNGHSFVTFGAGMLISEQKYLGSDIGFVSYNANIQGELNTFGTSSLGIAINGIYSKGPVPLQMQYALPGNISATGRDFTFRTLGVGKMFGDQVLTLTLQYNFRKEIYRLLPVSFLRNFSLNSFFNAAWKNMSARSAAIMPVEFTVLTSPLLETGFSIGYSSLPVNLEFAWRLTHIDRSGFQIGINTSVL